MVAVGDVHRLERRPVVLPSPVEWAGKRRNQPPGPPYNPFLEGIIMAWTRRDFVKASALAIPAAAVPSTARAQQPGAPGAPAAAPPAPPVFTPLRRNVGIFHQRGGTDGHPT